MSIILHKWLQSILCLKYQYRIFSSFSFSLRRQAYNMSILLRWTLRMIYLWLAATGVLANYRTIATSHVDVPASIQRYSYERIRLLLRSSSSYKANFPGRRALIDGEHKRVDEANGLIRQDQTWIRRLAHCRRPNERRRQRKGLQDRYGHRLLVQQWVQLLATQRTDLTTIITNSWVGFQ